VGDKLRKRNDLKFDERKARRRYGWVPIVEIALGRGRRTRKEKQLCGAKKGLALCHKKRVERKAEDVVFGETISEDKGSVSAAK